MLRAGASTVMVRLGDELFPNAESVLKHDDVYIRLLILETDRRFAILEADMPSMFPSEISYCKELLKEKAGVAHEDSWIVVNHSFSSPHIWPLEKTEMTDMIRPKALDENPHFLEIAKKINQAYKDAYDEAISAAVAELREAYMDFQTGICGINVNRNMYTIDGWWEGINFGGFTDPFLGVLRFNNPDGTPIAILYNYSMQVGVLAGNFPDLGGRVTSSDVVGAASLYVEQEFPGCTAIFLCGATGDQAPMFKCNYAELDSNGHTRQVNMGYEYADGILASMGNILGNAICQITQGHQKSPEIEASGLKKIEKSDKEKQSGDIKIITVRKEYKCHGQKREVDMHKMKPTHDFTYVPDKDRHLFVDIMIIGDVALVGLKPELDGITVAEIRDQSPFEKTIVCSFVNGNAKSMPQLRSYQLFQRAAMNSPFAAGSAERTRGVAINMLNEIKYEL